MCGICGIAYRESKEKVRAETLTEMLDTLTHRGPDEEGIFVKDGVGLGARRLSIIDLQTGNQPIFNEDRKICVVANGEIYNFQELRQELESKKHHFKTRTDTEVIVHLYEEVGMSFLERLDGMFAFALYDQRRKILFLVRDRLGIKPLYYIENNGQLIFASEVKAILRALKFRPSLNLQALDQYLTFEYVPTPNCIFEGIKKLPAANMLLYRNGAITIREYWDIDFTDTFDNNLKEEPLAEQIRALLKDSISNELVSDVGLGSFLSGGIDSSSIVALLPEDKRHNFCTFNIGFEERSFDESKFAREVSGLYGTTHYSQTLTQKDAFEGLLKLAGIMDEPFGDASIIPMYLLSKLARQKVKTVLSGDGADELFAGYPTYQAHRFAQFYLDLPASVRNLTKRVIESLPVSMKNISFDFKLKKFVEGIDYSPACVRHMVWMGSFSPQEKKSLYTQQVNDYLKDSDVFANIRKIFESKRWKSLLEATQYLDIKTYLQDDLLVKVDRASMANSLEVRVPYLDRKFVEFVCSLPTQTKLKFLQTKYIFKKAMRSILPAKIINRRKKGFGIPVAFWIMEEFRDLVLEVLNKDRLKQQSLFNPIYVNSLIQQHFEGTKDSRKLIWTLLMFQLWHEHYHR